MFGFRGLNLNVKLLGMSLFIGAVGVVSAGFGLWSVISMQEALVRQKQLNDLAHIQMQIDMLHDALRGDVMTGLSTLEPSSQLSLSTIQRQLAEHVGDLQSLKGKAALYASTEVVGADVVATLQDVQPLLSHYAATAGDVLAAAKSKPAADARALLPDFLNQFGVLEDKLGKFGDKIEGAADDQNDRIFQISKFNYLLMIGVLAFSTLAALMLCLIQRLQVILPLNQLVKVINKLANGDVDVEAPGVKRGDELGMIARAINVFRDHEITLRVQREEQERAKIAADQERRAAEATAIANERQLVIQSLGGAMEKLARKDLTFRMKSDMPEAYRKLQGDFNAAIEAFEGVISKLSESTAAINHGTREISTASDDLTQRTEMQAANLEETAAAVSDITNKVRAAATGAGHARDVVSAAKTEAAQSGEIVREAISAMNSIEHSSQQITQIIGVIDEIAFQTNLLALNAGVEAARAGDAGRGFAVVAQEVRGLAQRSAEAAKQIKTLIASSHSQVQHGVRLVGDTGTLLERIVKRVVEINDVVAEIAVGANEQAQSLGQVNSAVDSMDKATQQNAAMVEETTSATHKLANLSSDLHDIVSTFAISNRAWEPMKSSAPHLVVGETVPSRPVHREPEKPAVRPMPRQFARTGTDDDWSEF